MSLIKMLLRMSSTVKSPSAGACYGLKPDDAPRRYRGPENLWVPRPKMGWS
jgi:hypothetical protein